MAKKNNFWQENKLDIVPVLWCIGLVGLMGGAYLMNNKYNEKRRAEKIEAAKVALDTVNQTKDTIALSAIKQNQK